MAGMLMRNDTTKSLLKQGNTIPRKHNPRETQSQDQPRLQTTTCKCWLWNFSGSCLSLTITGDLVLHSQAEGWYLHQKTPTTNDCFGANPALALQNQLFKQNKRELNPFGNVTPSTPCTALAPDSSTVCCLPA